MIVDRRTVVCTAAALFAFAGNSVLTRLALGRSAIDPASFSTLRLAGGAGLLFAVTAIREDEGVPVGRSWLPAAVLFVYAIPFSFAYTRLTAGTGALILFGAVQVTMVAWAIRAGERPHASQWLGLALALAGLVYLVLPGLRAPSPLGSALMAVAGVAWGVYSVLGRGAANPLRLTAGNFMRALPLAMLVSILTWRYAYASTMGILVALICGAVTSGLGYVLWYAALRTLTATRAAIVQLMVPVLAGAGGVVFLGEAISIRLVLSGIAVLGGIALALTGGRRFG